MTSTVQNNTKTAGALLFIHAQTSLHPGSGTALGTVDLPIQRQRHTGWPTIAGSALKGILRDAYREIRKKHHDNSRKKANEEDDELVSIFGPGKAEESSEHAGALCVTDARILAFPVRSLRGVFAWVTCPAVLQGLQRDLTLAGLPRDNLPMPPAPGKNQAVVPNGSPLLVAGDKIVLEEFDFQRVGDCTELAKWLSQRCFLAEDSFTPKWMANHLVVLYEDDFTHFVRHATEVQARIALDYDRKTVKSGALFYQEFLPPETLFYTVLLAYETRRDDKNARYSPDQILDKVSDCLGQTKYLQIGGDETTGKGLCAVQVVR
ncbi:MAG: type III-B CRISPR module RAMP protein Cmr4 [Thermoguttaceae bacterium]|nr:type III-B CRISPR module RAMP protein Cmr4 [Thermoguttaceae bacterium]MDW8038105.1 type III-B CRISPR module RAMP protein Cmr4 [Thermoguttaceae bacterium]